VQNQKSNDTETTRGIENLAFRGVMKKPDQKGAPVRSRPREGESRGTDGKGFRKRGRMVDRHALTDRGVNLLAGQ